MGVLTKFFAKWEPGFSERLVRALRGHPEVRSVDWRREDMVLTVSLRDGTSHILNLANGEIEFARVLEPERDAFVQHWVELAFAHAEIPERWEHAAALLLPQLRSDDVPTVWRLQSRARTERPLGLAWRPLGSGLGVAFVVDQPTRMSFVLEDHVEQWGVGIDELYEVALANLAAGTPQPPRRLDHGLFGSPYGDCYDATRLLLSEWVESVPVRGERLVAAPTRDTVLIGDREQAAAMLHEAEAIMKQQGRPISPCLFVYEGGQLSPFRVSPEDPLFQAVRRSEVVQAVNRYGEQAQLIEEVHKQDGIDIHVAKLMAFEHSEAGLQTACVWIKGVHGWLPRADLVHVFPSQDAEEGFSVPWHEVQRIAGRYLVPIPELVPPRWEACTFPEGAVLEALRSASLEATPGGLVM